MAGFPEPPPWLPKEAVEKWAEIRSAMAATGVITLADAGALVGYCLAWAHLIRCQALLVGKGKGKGPIFTAKSGYSQSSAAWGQLNSSLEKLAKFGALLGLDPSSRTRVGGSLDAVEEEDALGTYLRSGGRKAKA